MTTHRTARWSIALAAVVFCTISFAADTNDQEILRKQFLDAFAKVEIGQDVSNVPLPKGWTQKALIQLIDVQFGKWDVWMEDGTTVFRIYPYFGRSEPKAGVGYSCVVLKVDKPSITVEKIVEAFEGHQSGEPLRVTEYSVDYPDGKSVHISKKKDKD